MPGAWRFGFPGRSNLPTTELTKDLTRSELATAFAVLGSAQGPRASSVLNAIQRHSQKKEKS